MGYNLNRARATRRVFGILPAVQEPTLSSESWAKWNSCRTRNKTAQFPGIRFGIPWKRVTIGAFVAQIIDIERASPYLPPFDFPALFTSTGFPVPPKKAAASADTTGASKKDILDLASKNNVHFLRLQFTDILGVNKNVEIPRSQFEKALDGDIMFDGSSIEGFVRIEESDMLLSPDLSTFQIFPWGDGDNRVARLICDINTPDGEPFAGDPRRVLRRQLDRARALGFSTMNAGMEAEFFMFKTGPNGEATTTTHDVGAYFDLAPVDLGEDARRAIVEVLEQMGFEVEAAHHEVAHGQHEIDFRYADALKTADNIATFRFIVRHVAQQFGLMASFMPKPVFGQNGSGMHTHQSLFRGKENAFWDKSAQWELSSTALNYIGGLLNHARGFCAITNPLVNSYKRLVPGYEAPVNLAYSRRNRSAACRIPMYSASPKARRVEFRPPDPSCNPYLGFSAMLMAGLDGVINRIEPGEPLDKDIYDLSPEEMKSVPSMPGSLEEALTCLEEDHQFLLKGDVFTEELLETFIDYKRKAEAEAIRLRPHPYEFALYYDI
jgi:glutamine synthetase